MRNLDITTLRSFVAVADTGGVTRAASFLHLTQSAVSMQLKRLEEMLGVELLDRSGRNIGLTAAGEQLLGFARKMLSLNDEIITRLTDQAFEGEVTLGVPHDVVHPVIPMVMQRFNVQFPRVKVNLCTSNTRDLKMDFDQGRFDLIVTTETALARAERPSTRCRSNGLERWVGRRGASARFGSGSAAIASSVGWQRLRSMMRVSRGKWRWTASLTAPWRPPSAQIWPLVCCLRAPSLRINR